MTTASDYAPFYTFDQVIQTPFSSGMTATVQQAMSAIQGPLTAAIVLWLIVTGILVMRGDITARTGIVRILSSSLVVGILMSSTLYNQYVVSFFTTGLPDWLAASLTGTTGNAPSAHQFDVIWNNADALFATSRANLNFYNVLYSVELALLQDLVVFPIGATFLIYEFARIMIDVMASIGPFLIIGYLFSATRGVADRWIGKLTALSIQTLLVDIILSIVINGDMSYYNTAANLITAQSSIDQTVTISLQFFSFISLGAAIACLIPAIAAFLGGGISVSPINVIATIATKGKGRSR